MNEKAITYRQLFIILESLGFQQKRSSESPTRIFFHAPTDTILAFGRKHDDVVTPADILSTEVHLHGRGIVDEPLESLIEAAPSNT